VRQDDAFTVVLALAAARVGSAAFKPTAKSHPDHKYLRTKHYQFPHK
jgi:hypothetical protein